MKKEELILILQSQLEEKKIEIKKPAPQTQVKTQKAAASSARTGVGAKKG